MKKIIALFLLAATMVSGQTVLDLGAQGKLTLYLFDGWTADTTDMAGKASFTIRSTRNVNARCEMTIHRMDRDRFDSKARLKTQVEADGYPFGMISLEGRAIAKEFKLSMPGYGLYCNFTADVPSGAKPEPGKFNAMSIGKIRPAPNVLIDVLIYADDLRSTPYNDLLGMVEGMEYTPNRGR